MPRKIGFAAVLLVAIVFISSCPEPTTSGPTTYERIVIETYPWKFGIGTTDTTLRLYDSAGIELANDENGTGWAKIDYTTALDPGTYYIKINSDNLNPGAYVVRALSLRLGEGLPAYNYPGAFKDEPWPDGDDNAPLNIPTAPLDISLGNANWLNRYLTTQPDHDGAPYDVDWCELVLP